MKNSIKIILPTILAVLLLLAGCTATGENNPSPGEKELSQAEITALVMNDSRVSGLLDEGFVFTSISTGTYSNDKEIYVFRFDQPSQDPGLHDRMAAVLVAKNGAILTINQPHPAPVPPGADTGSHSSTGFSMAIEVNTTATDIPEAEEWLIKGLNINAQGVSYTEAITCYDRALALDPIYTEAWVAKGISFCNLNDYEKAIECFDSALSIDPSCTSAADTREIVLSRMNRSDKAN